MTLLLGEKITSITEKNIFMKNTSVVGTHSWCRAEYSAEIGGRKRRFEQKRVEQVSEFINLSLSSNFSILDTFFLLIPPIFAHNHIIILVQIIQPDLVRHLGAGGRPGLADLSRNFFATVT